MPAPIGNRNKANGIAIRQLLISELENGGRDRVRAAIRMQIQKAEEGDLKALEFLADRIDGKPGQSVEVTGADGGPVAMSLAVSFKAPSAD